MNEYIKQQINKMLFLVLATGSCFLFNPTSAEMLKSEVKEIHLWSGRTNGFLGRILDFCFKANSSH